MGRAVTELPIVFAFLDFRAFLRAWFTAKKLRNPRFSHRLFARRAGLRSPALLANVVEGRRNLTAASAGRFAAAMNLDAESSAFFLALVRMSCADDPLTRDRALEQIRATQRFREARRLDQQALEFLARWYLPALHELSACDGFREDPAWIAGVLRPALSERQAAEALATLCEMGLLRRDASGRLTRADASVVTPHEVAGLAARQYHAAMMERAREGLEFPAHERHLCGVTVAVPSALLARVKAELDAFQERVLDLCDGADAPRTQVVQINLHAFPVSACFAVDA